MKKNKQIGLKKNPPPILTVFIYLNFTNNSTFYTFFFRLVLSSLCSLLLFKCSLTPLLTDSLLITNTINHMLMYVSKCKPYIFRNLASGPTTRKQHLFSSIYPRLSAARRETTGVLPSISSCTGGALGDKFHSYRSPLASHQAHVVPEQMLFKCILFRF